MIKTANSNYLTGRILLAMPGLDDPRFHRAVIFLCAHDEKGAMGLIVNHTLPGLELQELMAQLDIVPAQETINNGAHMPVLSGGPVEAARGFVLHTTDFKQSDTIEIDERFSITGTVDALKAIAQGNGPHKMLFVLGYAGWDPGQLDQELQQNAWLVADADPDLIFRPSAEQKWEDAVRKLGIDPAMLSGSAGHA